MTDDRPRPAALVTGGARGIGRAIVDVLVERGWSVAAADISEEALRELDGVPHVMPVVCDVADAGSVDSAVASAVAALGGLDLVVNNAGIGSFRSVFDLGLDEWNGIWAINVTSVLLVSRAAYPHLAASGRGAVVNIASDAARQGMKERAAYCTTKGAVVSLTRAMAADFVDGGVRVNSVSPSAVDNAWLRQRDLTDAQLAEAKAELTRRVPMGRLAAPADIAHAVLWLASDDAGYVTGQDVVVDGGANAIR